MTTILTSSPRSSPPHACGHVLPPRVDDACFPQFAGNHSSTSPQLPQVFTSRDTTFPVSLRRLLSPCRFPPARARRATETASFRSNCPRPTLPKENTCRRGGGTPVC